MDINKEKVKRLAKLARLSFNEIEMDGMVDDLKKILKFINKLDEINTDGVKPLIHIHDKVNILREDKTSHIDIKASILKNAPSHNSDYIKAPKVLKQK